MTAPASIKHDTREVFDKFAELWRRNNKKFFRKALRLAQGNRDLADTFMSRTALNVVEYLRRESVKVRNLEAARRARWRELRAQEQIKCGSLPKHGKKTGERRHKPIAQTSIQTNSEHFIAGEAHG